MRLYQRSAGRRPDPEPLRTNDRATVLAGIGLWAVALVTMLLLRATGSPRTAAAGGPGRRWPASGSGSPGLDYLRRTGRR